MSLFRRLVRAVLLAAPQWTFPESLERRFFSFDEIASRAHREGILNLLRQLRK